MTTPDDATPADGPPAVPLPPAAPRPRRRSPTRARSRRLLARARAALARETARIMVGDRLRQMRNQELAAIASGWIAITRAAGLELLYRGMDARGQRLPKRERKARIAAALAAPHGSRCACGQCRTRRAGC